MILQSLHRLYARIADDPAYGMAPPGYSVQKISFKVVLRPSGELFAIQDAQIPVEGRSRPQQLAVPGTGKPSGQGINPCFLWDNTGYMLGYKPDDPKPERSRQTFEAFRDRHLGLEQAVNCPAFSAVCRFLEQWDPETASGHPVLAETTAGFGVFQLLGEAAYVHQNQRIRQWWEAENSGESDAPVGQCLLTGERAPVARLQPKIKGVSGGKAEASLVAFNEAAYESYGKAQAYNAPVSELAAERYGAALNALLDGPMHSKHRFALGDMTVAFWTGTPTVTEDIFAQFCSGGASVAEDENAQDEAVREKLECFLKALRQGQEAYGELAHEAQTPFFLLGLSPNAARLSVRFFHAGKLAELLDNLRRHFRDIAVKPQPARGKRRGDPEFQPTWLLLAQTARERKEIPPVLAGPLLQAIVTGAPYPHGLFAAIVRRIHADRTVNYPRTCMIKGYLTRNRKQEVSMSLDTERTEPAYRLGRLFAALEKTQGDALPGIVATIRDRFYSAASATPGAVFPRLLRTYQHHLAKLEGGRKVNREKLVQEILAPLQNFPAHLNLADQGLFAIGYYHQTQDFYTSKSEPAELADAE